MNKDVVRKGAAFVAEQDGRSLKKDVGEFALTTGLGGLGLWVTAGVLPFITLPMLLVVVAVLGGWLYIKG